MSMIVKKQNADYKTPDIKVLCVKVSNPILNASAERFSETEGDWGTDPE